MPAKSENSSGDGAALVTMMYVLLWSVVAGLAALLLADTSGVAAAVGIGALIFFAAFAMGCFFGFLFGVPRVLSKELGAASSATPSHPASLPAGLSPQPDPAGANTNQARVRLLQSNTNLERISDWLTTLLVGAGLAELHNLNDALLMFRHFLEQTARVFPAGPNGVASAGALPAIGPIVMIFGLAVGFLYMYLNTRLVLIRLFQSVEEMISGLPESAQRAVRAAALQSDGASFVSEQLATKNGATIDDALGVMFDLLYKADPGKVIDLGARLSATDATRRAEYWFYLAAAFGQQLHDLQRGTPDWNSARDNALDCARRAVLIDPSYRARLWSISNPQSSDNDLAELRSDREFLRIVNRTDDA